MGWGAMMGLGESLQAVGGMMSDNQKAKMAEQLALEREERAEIREQAREERKLKRELMTPDPKQTAFDSTSGMKIIRNSAGEELRREPALPDEIRQHQFDIKKDEITLENLLSTGEATKLLNEDRRRDAATYDEDRSLERRYKEAQIGAANRRGTDSDDPEDEPSQSELASVLSKQFPGLRKQYVDPDGDVEGTLTADEYEEIAYESVRAAAERGADAADTFRRALKARAAFLKNKKAVVPKRSGLTLGQ